jgi:hypothetical protein
MRTGTGILLAVLLAVGTDAGARTKLRKPARGFQVRTAPFTVAPAQDLEVCEYRRLPNAKPMDVSGFELRMPAGAHHFVIWAYGGGIEDDGEFPAGPVPAVGCAGLAPDDLVPQVLIPIQTPNSRFQFPEGVALTLEPHQQVWLNSHLRNGGPLPIVPDTRFNFYRARKGTVQHHAQGLIVGNMAAIHVPAGGDQTITAEWTAPVEMTLVQLATHQHRLGTYANIEIVRPDGVTRDKVYENSDWEHPWTYWPKPAIRLAAGQKMRITCTWHNTDGHDVRFGPKTTDEMCFILGFYYRDGDVTDPVGGGQCLPARRGLLCPLAPAVAD